MTVAASLRTRLATAALVGAAAVSLTGCGYNDFQRLDEQNKAAWSEVLNQYQRRADLILSQARSDADAVRDDADDYVAKSLTQLQSELERISNQVANGIRVVQDEQERRATAAAQTAECRRAGSNRSQLVYRFEASPALIVFLRFSLRSRA